MGLPLRRRQRCFPVLLVVVLIVVGEPVCIFLLYVLFPLFFLLLLVLLLVAAVVRCRLAASLGGVAASSPTPRTRPTAA
jgi:hypothetical protein